MTSNTAFDNEIFMESSYEDLARDLSPVTMAVNILGLYRALPTEKSHDLRIAIQTQFSILRGLLDLRI